MNYAYWEYYSFSLPRRNRALNRGNVQYVVDPDSLVIEDSNCKMDLVSKGAGATLLAEIFALKDNMFRVKINEKSPIRPRYEARGALVMEPELLR